MEYILITNSPDIAMYAQDCGVHRIMVDLEIKGKRERQGHLDTVISCHDLSDIAKVRDVVKTSKLIVRVNPIDNESQDEISKVIDMGADIVMLPMFKSVSEVTNFVKYVNGRAKCCLLLETPAAVARIDQILEVPKIDEIHVGLNDLHLGFGLDFMFELLSGGVVEYLSKKINNANITFGFGGIARLGKGAVDSSLILSEHHRLNSRMVILSRDFYGGVANCEELKNKINLKKEIDALNSYYNQIMNLSYGDLIKNKLLLDNCVRSYIERL